MRPFPTYHQLDSMDCGAPCLRIISKYYGKYLVISDAAEQLEFRT